MQTQKQGKAPYPKTQETLLVLSQVYVPDPASVGQHMADAAEEMAQRGWQVRVYTANRGYDDPNITYTSHENLNGVDVRRLPFSSFGKKNLAFRLAGQLSFLFQCILRGVFIKNLAGIFITTSPPMGSMAALAIGFFRRVPIKYWVMDLNPDQALALGKLEPGSLLVKGMNWLNLKILGRADNIIVLDRFMAERILLKRQVQKKISIMPPWPMEGYLEVIPHEKNPFRKDHKLDGRFVFMYSGNHSPAHPLTTLLEAALRLRDREDIIFIFIGGGMGKKEVEAVISEHRPNNIISLPYQPLDKIKYSLSAADIHLVAMGNEMVGCVHPCKAYGAMSLGKPILLIGPDPCHISELIATYQIGWQISHGNVEQAVKTIQQIVSCNPEILAEKGRRAADAVQNTLSKAALCKQFCDVLEQGLHRKTVTAQAAILE